MKNQATARLAKITEKRRRLHSDNTITEIDTAYREWSVGNYYKDGCLNSANYGWFVEIETGLPVCKF